MTDGTRIHVGDDALRRHEAFDLEAAMANAVAAAAAAFREAGMPAPNVVVNVAWTVDAREFVAGSAVQAGTPVFIADSLRATAEEIESLPSARRGTAAS